MKYPYLLPAAITGSTGLIAAVSAIFLLTEVSVLFYMVEKVDRDRRLCQPRYDGHERK